MRRRKNDQARGSTKQSDVEESVPQATLSTPGRAVQSTPPRTAMEGKARSAKETKWRRRVNDVTEREQQLTGAVTTLLEVGLHGQIDRSIRRIGEEKNRARSRSTAEERYAP